MRRLLVVVKQDTVYKKIKQVFADYEVLPNIPMYLELQEFVIGEEATLAIIDGTLHWKDKAENLLNKYDMPYVLFSGNFDELRAKVDGKTFSNKPQLVAQTVSGSLPNDPAGQGNEPGREAPAPALTLQVPSEYPLAEPVREATLSVPQEPVIQYVDREIIKEVPKFIDREVIKEVERIVEKRVEVPVEVKVEVPVEVPVEVRVEVPVERRVNVHQLRAMPKQLIVVGSLYSGAGSSFVSIALAKVLNSLRVETCVLEYPANEPYLYIHLDGATRMPRDYSYLFPQVMQGQDIKRRNQEWQDEYITWMPADPALGPMANWTGELMARCLFGVKSAVTILDISSSWDDPELKDILLQADQLLLVAGPEPARLLSSQARTIKNYLKKEIQQVEIKVIANFVPDVPNRKTREWIESLPGRTITRIPGLRSAEIVDASWKGRTVFDDNPQLVDKFTDCFFPLVRQIIPKDYMLERPKGKGFINRLTSKLGRRDRA